MSDAGTPLDMRCCQRSLRARKYIHVRAVQVTRVMLAEKQSVIVTVEFILQASEGCWPVACSKGSA
jgi:hypothetical protein